MDLRAGLWRSGEEKNPLALPIVQHATYSLYRLGSFYLPNNATFFEAYKLQSPSLEFSKQSCSFLPVSSHVETFLAAPRCQTLLYKTAAESEAEYLKQRLGVRQHSHGTKKYPRNITWYGPLVFISTLKRCTDNM